MESPIGASAVSMGGSNEFVECFCGGAVVEGGSGIVVELVGDGVDYSVDAILMSQPSWEIFGSTVSK